MDEGVYFSSYSNFHSQWIFRNFSLHDKQRGYLRLRLRKEVLREIHKLLETPPLEVPPECQYLLEPDHLAMYYASYEKQAYWVLALKAARRAGRRAATSKRARGCSQHTRLTCDFSTLDDHMGYKLRGQNVRPTKDAYTYAPYCRPTSVRPTKDAYAYAPPVDLQDTLSHT